MIRVFLAIARLPCILLEVLDYLKSFHGRATVTMERSLAQISKREQTDASAVPQQNEGRCS